MVLATTTTGKFLGMFRDREDAELFARGQKSRYFTTVRLAELTESTSSNWRTKTMPLFMLGALLPVHNPYVIGFFALSLVAVVGFSFRPLKADVPTFCNDPDLPYWRWIAEGCWMRTAAIGELFKRKVV